MRNERLRPYRERVIGAAEGRVLEIGSGSGQNLPFYRPVVREVLALEPDPNLLAMARRVPRSEMPVKFIEASAEAIPLDDGSVDTVVTTWTLCTVPGADAALSEMRRVLRPGAGCYSSSTGFRLTVECAGGRIPSLRFGGGSRAAAASTARSDR
ncbi:SAM-dependent methyltransferase [Sinorhizobium alkalisoli]|nr:SAM-dependent methyltransferase [Sinorhizobium alkalisoli]